MRKDDGLSNNWCFSLIFRLGIGKTTKTKIKELSSGDSGCSQAAGEEKGNSANTLDF